MGCRECRFESGLPYKYLFHFDMMTYLSIGVVLAFILGVFVFWTTYKLNKNRKSSSTSSLSEAMLVMGLPGVVIFWPFVVLMLILMVVTE